MRFGEDSSSTRSHCRGTKRADRSRSRLALPGNTRFQQATDGIAVVESLPGSGRDLPQRPPVRLVNAVRKTAPSARGQNQGLGLAGDLNKKDFLTRYRLVWSGGTSAGSGAAPALMPLSGGHGAPTV